MALRRKGAIKDSCPFSVFAECLWMKPVQRGAFLAIFEFKVQCLILSLETYCGDNCLVQFTVSKHDC